MQQKSKKLLIIPLISLSIFLMIVFSAAYAYYVANTSMNTSNYQISMPQVTALTCTKSDCSVTVTPAQMSTSTTDNTNAAATSSCSLNCTCSGSPGAVCDYSVRLIEMGTQYIPSSSIGTNKEFTAKVTSPSNCTVQNTSNEVTQVDIIRDKVVSNCTLTVPQSGSVSANTVVEFKWYNLDADQSIQARKNYMYQLTNDNQLYTVIFDANGGSVGTSSKQVVYGEAYGELPTPTWSGHTFRGWNGKNIFNVYSYTNSYRATITDGVITYDGSHREGNIPDKIRFQRINNNTYLTDLDAYTISVGYHRFTFTYDGTFNKICLRENTNKSDPTLMYNANFEVGTTYTVSYHIDYFDKPRCTTIISNFQIEEGSTATLFEPYYITETTKVVQAQDHTLTAIWD